MSQFNMATAPTEGAAGSTDAQAIIEVVRYIKNLQCSELMLAIREIRMVETQTLR